MKTGRQHRHNDISLVDSRVHGRFDSGAGIGQHFGCAESWSYAQRIASFQQILGHRPPMLPSPISAIWLIFSP